MKRHESIAALSRDHHTGLLFCWKLRQGLNRTVPPERMRPYVEYFWNHHLRQHFSEEETILFAALRDNVSEQAMAEHAQIRQLAGPIIAGTPVLPEQLRQLADMVDRHIRFEERVLFPHIEKMLPAEKLAEIGAALQQQHQSGAKDDYPDEFWA